MKRFKIFKALTQEIQGVKKPLVILGFFKVWNLIFSIIPMVLYSLLINYVLVDKNMYLLWYIVIGYIVSFLLSTIGVIFSKKFSNRLLLKYDLKIKRKLLKKYAGLDNDVYNKYSVGDIRSRVENDSVVAENFFITHILDFIFYIAKAIILAIILLYYDWRIALISFIFIPITFLTVNFLGKKTKKFGAELWKLQAEY